jgi:hypothetical protein
VHAAGIVADHATERAAVVGGGIGRKGKAVPFGGGAKLIEDDSGLDASQAARGIDFEDRRHVFGEIEDDSRVAALSGERRAAAAGEQRSAMVATKCDRRADIFLIARNYNANGDLTIIRAVGGVESPASGVKADFSAEMAAERGFKGGGVELRGTDLGERDVLRHGYCNIFVDARLRRKGIAGLRA